jgi:hypothetical protein
VTRIIIRVETQQIRGQHTCMQRKHPHFKFVCLLQRTACTQRSKEKQSKAKRSQTFEQLSSAR